MDDGSNTAALKKILALGLGAGGIGMAARGVAGLQDLFRKPEYTSPPGGMRPAVVRVAVPQFPQEEEDPRARRRGPLLKRSDFWSRPYVIPGVMAAGAGGLYGGWKLADKLLDDRRKADSDDALAAAKKRYRQALLEQYSADTPGLQKASSLAEDLDKLYNMTKQAEPSAEEPWWSRGGGDSMLGSAKGVGLGAYGALAALLAGGAGIGTYNYLKARSPEERLAKAIKQREKLRWATRPPEIYAVSRPTPVQVSPFGSTGGEAQDSGEGKAKIASAGAAKYAGSQARRSETANGAVVAAKEVAALYRP